MTTPRCTFRKGRSPAPAGRRAMTLVELLAVVAIITLLVAIMMPAVNGARESARQVACQSNLRQFGIGMAVVAERRNGAFCTGAFDWLRDGCVTEIGWVADLVNSGVPTGKMLCPSNPAQAAAAYADLLDADAGSFDSCVNRAGGEPEILPDGSQAVNPCRQIISGAGTYSAGSEARRELVERLIYLKHYNTNYTASWFLVRSEVLLTSSGNLRAVKASCGRSLVSRNSTAGPRRREVRDRSPAASSFVPLLGCGAAAGTLSAVLGRLPPGTSLAKTMTNGPVMKTTMERPANFASGTSQTGPDGWWATWSSTLQDYRGFAPVHRGVCNLLFADGSVRAFVDENRDGLLNNGFPASAEFGFSGSQVELLEGEVFSRWSLQGR